MNARRNAASALLVLTATLHIGCGSSKPTTSKPVPKPTFTVGKETTLFTEPLDANGYIDYEAAVNERLRGKIKSEDNAVVLLVQALGPKPEGNELPASFYHWLGVDSPPAGAYLVDNYQHFRDMIDNDQDKSFAKRQAALLQAVWKATDDPEHAELLKLNEKPLSLAVEASKRSVYYHPFVSPKLKEKPGLLLEAPVAVSAKVRELAWMLTLRATLHAGEGRREAAWADVFAALRLSRLVSHGGSEVESLIGAATEMNTLSVAVVLLEHTQPTATVIRAIRDEFVKLPRRAALEDKLELASRVTFLELTQTIYRNGIQTLRTLGMDNGRVGEPDETDERLRAAIDWDVPLKAFQHWFERFAAAHAAKSHAERVQAWAAIKSELEKLKNESTALSTLGEQAKKNSGGPKPEVSKKCADNLVSHLMPNTPQVSEAYYRAEQQTRNLQLAFALAAYHADHKKYPASLGDLTPKYIDRVPDDVFCGKPLIYKPSDGGYLLHSLGVNGKDDGGSGDDLVVRMPSAGKR